MRWKLEGIYRKRSLGRWGVCARCGSGSDLASRGQTAKALDIENLGLSTGVVDGFLSGADVRINAVYVYTVESWVYKVVNRALREHDETKAGLAPYIRVLHDSVANPEGPLERWTGRCYRWMRLDAATLRKYAPNPVIGSRENEENKKRFSAEALAVAYRDDSGRRILSGPRASSAD